MIQLKDCKIVELYTNADEFNYHTGISVSIVSDKGVDHEILVKGSVNNLILFDFLSSPDLSNTTWQEFVSGLENLLKW